MLYSRFRHILTWLPLVPILLLGFALLVAGLTATSLWSDEGWTIAATDGTTPMEIITGWVKPDVHPPLFFLELRLWRAFTGDAIFELRYFSVLISTLGIVLAYRLGKSLFGNRAGWFAALFYALHDLVNVLTHEVRHYPQQMLLVTLALWLYWRFYRRPTPKNGSAFALAGAALIYTHYWGGFILLGMALHALITKWGRWQPSQDMSKSVLLHLLEQYKSNVRVEHYGQYKYVLSKNSRSGEILLIGT